MKARFHKRSKGEQGYILLVLLLAIALFSIALLTEVQSLAFQIRRDREEELIHRGVQYSRAVRLFVRRFHRYPGSIAELENTNNIRFLRKQYKDPITGKAFQLLYMDKVAAFYRAPVPQPAAGPPEAKMDTSSPEYAQYAAEEAVRQAEAYGQPLPEGSTGASAAATNTEALQASGASTAAGSPTERPDTQDEAPAISGVPIVGVASLSKKETIREFDKKNHYNEWLFIFSLNSPNSGTLINSPDQPSRVSTAQARNLQDENSPESARLGQDSVNANISPGATPWPAK